MAAREPWRVLFMGTPAFACTILEALLTRADPVVGIVCQPDRPRGRGLALGVPEVKARAEQAGLPVLQPERLRDAPFQDALRALAPDLIVVAAYGKILPHAILDLPPRGCINVHASLLPRHRGAAPVAWAILSGDTRTGVTIMAMVEEMDAGDILLQREVVIAPEETGGTLTERLAHLGGTALLDAIDGLKDGTLSPIPQPAVGVTFAPRLTRDILRIDWTRAGEHIARQVRALAPAPSAFTTVGGRVFKIHRAVAEADGPAALPGAVVEAGRGAIRIATGAGMLRLLEVQLEGKRKLTAAEFLAGNPLPAGTCLGAS